MKRIVLVFLAGVSLLAALPLRAETRPHYGGALRVELRERVASLDPREWPADTREAAAAEKLASLVFERLVRLDENGRPQPALAIWWQKDTQAKRWEFRLRPGVVFDDGTPLTADAVAAAWRLVRSTGPAATGSGDTLVIQSDQPMPDLPAELARGRDFIFRVTPDGRLAGTGPFRITEWQPRSRLVLAANENHWAGRPFLDSITVGLGISPQQQMIDLELGRADVVELAPEQIRRAALAGTRTWSSLPVELLALEFDVNRPAVQDARGREALALAIDRGAIWSVLLQRQGEAATSLLPQWLSGYAFLFRTERDLNLARQLHELVRATGPLVLVYDVADAQARTVADRIVVDAREAGIAVQVSAAGTGAYDARLVRRRFAAVEPGAALAELASAFGLAEMVRLNNPSPEQVYAAERALLEMYRVVPLAYVPESCALSARVRNWMPAHWGDWRLEDAWLDASAPPPAGGKP